MGQAIEVEHLTKSYGNVTAVDDISFTVEAGDVFAFLGPNGAGKTTTVEIIEMIRSADEGTVRVLGRDIHGQPAAIKEDIGVLPQEFQSFERLTVRETITYFARLYRRHADIDRIIDLMDLHDKENDLYRTLSGGLKQRVGVGIALVNDPDIVFLDEPTMGLDPKARRDVWNAIAGLREEGKTVFLTTHYMEEAEYLADHIAIIHRGRIVAEGSLDELIQQYGGKSVLSIRGTRTDEVMAALQRKGYDTKAKNSTVEVKIDKKDAVIDILFHLREQGLYYREVDIKHSDLENVFLNITGTSLGEEDL